MQSILRHPNITLLMGVQPKMPHIIIAFEYVEQSLFTLLHMKKQVQISNEQRVKICADLANVFNFIHHSGIVHRDIKSHNVLLDSNFNIKVCDFGLARFRADLNKGSMQFAGTPTYMAPELFQKRAYDEKVDVFSYGTLVWEIMNREVPFDGLDPADIRSKVEKEEKLKAAYGIEPRLNQLINDCRAANPAQRPQFDEIVKLFEQIKK